MHRVHLILLYLLTPVISDEHYLVFSITICLLDAYILHSFHKLIRIFVYPVCGAVQVSP